MTNLKKIILPILISAIVILILFIGLFFFTIEKNGTTGFDNIIGQQEKIALELKESMPKTSFWIESKEKGNWFNVDSINSHKNKVLISIYDQSGELVVKSHFIIICPSTELKLIGDLKSEIDYYDGENIQLKGNCFLLKN